MLIQTEISETLIILPLQSMECVCVCVGGGGGGVVW